MGKGLRSNKKKHFRTLKRAIVEHAPSLVEAEKRKQDELQSVVEAEKPAHEDGNTMALESIEMETKNPARILRKLKARRLAAGLGSVHAEAMKKKKKANALAGANQFHKKKKKKRR